MKNDGEKMRQRLIRLLHVQLNTLGITPEGKEALYSGYGVATSKDMTVTQLRQLTDILRTKMPAHGDSHAAKKADYGIWMRRAQVAVGKALAAKGYIKADGWLIDDWNKINATVHRASGCKDGEKPTTAQLRRVYGEFCRQRETAQRVESELKVES